MKLFKKVGCAILASMLMTTAVAPTHFNVAAQEVVTIPNVSDGPTVSIDPITDGTIELRDASVTLNGQPVTTIVPDSYEVYENEWNEYEAVFQRESRAYSAFVRIPVKVEEPGYLTIYAESISTTANVEASIRDYDDHLLSSFYSIGAWTNSERNLCRGAYIRQPGTYYVKLFDSYSLEVQKIKFKLGFTKADKKLPLNTDIMVPGMGGDNVYLEYKSTKPGFLRVSFNGNEQLKMGWNISNGPVTLCDAYQNAIGNPVQNVVGKTIQWEVGKGTYYIKSNLNKGLCIVRATYMPFLKTPTITAPKAGQKIIKGKVDKKVTVNVQVGNVLYKTTSKSNGTYSVKVPKLKNKTKIKVWTTSNDGRYSKVRSVRVKK